MAISIGYRQLQPKYILGTDQWISAAAEQMVGADLKRANQLREHFPFYPIARGRTVIVPRLVTLSTTSFLGSDASAIDTSVSALADPPDEIDIAAIVGDATMTHYPQTLESYSVNQLQLEIEFKKLAAVIAFWDQVFRRQRTNGFRGLPDLVADSQVIDASGVLVLDALDDLVTRVDEADSEMDRKAVVMNSRTFIDFVRQTRKTGASVQYAVRGGRRYAVHNGVTIHICDYIPIGESFDNQAENLTTVWCMTLGDEDKGVFGVYPSDVGKDGWVVEPTERGHDQDTMSHRVRWYVAIVLRQPRGLACVANVKLAN